MIRMRDTALRSPTVAPTSPPESLASAGAVYFPSVTAPGKLLFGTGGAASGFGGGPAGAGVETPDRLPALAAAAVGMGGGVRGGFTVHVAFSSRKNPPLASNSFA